MTGPTTLPSSETTPSNFFVASYDLGYEFSQEHYVALQCMVEDAAEDKATLAHVPELETAA